MITITIFFYKRTPGTGADDQCTGINHPGLAENIKPVSGVGEITVGQ
jgi:hypothetical protein